MRKMFTSLAALIVVVFATVTFAEPPYRPKSYEQFDPCRRPDLAPLVKPGKCLATVSRALTAAPSPTCTGRYVWRSEHPGVVWDETRGEVGLPGVVALIPPDPCAVAVLATVRADQRIPAECNRWQKRGYTKHDDTCRSGNGTTIPKACCGE